jgi:hypothetical protein
MKKLILNRYLCTLLAGISVVQADVNWQCQYSTSLVVDPIYKISDYSMKREFDFFWSVQKGVLTVDNFFHTDLTVQDIGEPIGSTNKPDWIYLDKDGQVKGGKVLSKIGKVSPEENVYWEFFDNNKGNISGKDIPTADSDKKNKWTIRLVSPVEKLWNNITTQAICHKVP